MASACFKLLYSQICAVNLVSGSLIISTYQVKAREIPKVPLLYSYGSCNSFRYERDRVSFSYLKEPHTAHFLFLFLFIIQWSKILHFDFQSLSLHRLPFSDVCGVFFSVSIVFPSILISPCFHQQHWLETDEEEFHALWHCNNPWLKKPAGKQEW